MSTAIPKDWAGFHWQPAYSLLPAVLHQAQKPTPVRDPQLVFLNQPLAEALGLDAEALRSDRGIALLAGNLEVEALGSIAQAYAGHQFGHFNILGDGRAILLGEHRLKSGKLVDIQWKGSGPTVFSRRGDGRLALGPALRELLISEAMAALEIPTTRSLAVVATGEPVFREQPLPGAVLTRIAASHVRVGTFQFAAVQEDLSAVRALMEFCISRHYPEIEGGSESERAVQFFEGVIDRQADLIARWLSVGFIHGVMNTDNMTISGETIDFGPCAFLNTYDPEKAFSSIDRHGRYAFGQQPGIAGWNLARLGETLVPLLAPNPDDGIRIATELLQKFAAKFDQQFLHRFGAKLGFTEVRKEDAALLQELLAIAARENRDFHGLWLELTDVGPRPDVLSGGLSAWGERWLARLNAEGSAGSAAERMRRVNPIVIPRNHRVEEALSRAMEGDLAPFQALWDAVRRPFIDTTEQRAIAAPPSVEDPSYRTFCGT